MPGRFQYGKLSKYPHMKPEDVAVWEKFMRLNPLAFQTVDYDVRVGEGLKMPENTPENIARGHKALTQKKIDVVAYINDETWIIEVKPTANMRGLGQAIVYRNLYLKDNPDVTKLFTAVLADEVEREVERAYSESGVQLIEV